MNLPDQTLKRAWITAGHSDLWHMPNTGIYNTYTRIEYSRLPPLEQSDHDFQWLSELPARDHECNLASEENLQERLGQLDAELHSLGHVLPANFKQFIAQPDLQAQIPTCTDCYLELSDSVQPLPGHSGCHVVRFMNDSQCCILWYLLFQPGLPPRVLASDYFIERDIFDAMEYENPEQDSGPLSHDAVLRHACICAESFGEFIHRFCLENTIWFALHEKLPMAQCERDYLTSAQNKRA